MTTFHLKVTNGSTTKVDLSSVVLTTVYGTGSKRIAAPVYGGEAADFSGTLGLKKTATAAYTYAIPKKERGSVAISVDLDAGHQIATFTGSAE